MQKEDVRAAIFKASPLKAPGQDNIPVLIWQKLWPVLHEQVFSLFSESLRQGKLPKKWKLAKIIPLKKPGKADLTEPSAFRPSAYYQRCPRLLKQSLQEGLHTVKG